MVASPRGKGRDGRTCGAKKRQGGDPCTQIAGWGTSHPGFGRCKLHGGSTATVGMGAARESADRAAREVLASMDVAPIDDPLTELSKLAGQVVAWRDTCARLVNELNDKDLRYQDAKAAEQLRAEVEMFERSLDRCGRLLVDIARLNIDERLAVIEGRRADAIVRACDAAIASLGFTGTEASTARHAFARELRIAG